MRTFTPSGDFDLESYLENEVFADDVLGVVGTLRELQRSVYEPQAPTGLRGFWDYTQSYLPSLVTVRMRPDYDEQHYVWNPLHKAPVRAILDAEREKRGLNDADQV